MRKRLVYGFFIVAAGILVTLGIVPLFAQPQGTMSLFEVLAPTSGQVVEGPQMPISVNFRTVDGVAVLRFDVYLDGKMFYGDKKFGGTFSKPNSEGNFNTLDNPTSSPDIARANPSVGKHKITISLTDARGRVSERSVTIDYKPMNTHPVKHIPPKVRITSPKNGDVIDGSTQIKVDAQAGDSAVALVKVFIDGQMWSMTNTQPYEMTWNPIDGKFSTGSHTLLARALDVFNFEGESEPVFVLVKNPYMPGKPNPTPIDAVTTTLPDLPVQAEQGFSNITGPQWTPAMNALLPDQFPLQTRALLTAVPGISVIPVAIASHLPATDTLTNNVALAGFSSPGAMLSSPASMPGALLVDQPSFSITTHIPVTRLAGDDALPAYSGSSAPHATLTNAPYLLVSVPQLPVTHPAIAGSLPIQTVETTPPTNVVINTISPLQPTEFTSSYIPFVPTQTGSLSVSLPSIMPTSRGNVLDLPLLSACFPSQIALPNGAPSRTLQPMTPGEVAGEHFAALDLFPTQFNSAHQAWNDTSSLISNPFSFSPSTSLPMAARRDTIDLPSLSTKSHANIPLPGGPTQTWVFLPVTMTSPDGEHSSAIAVLPTAGHADGSNGLAHGSAGVTVPTGLTGTPSAVVPGPQTANADNPVIAGVNMTPSALQPKVIPPAISQSILAPGKHTIVPDVHVDVKVPVLTVSIQKNPLSALKNGKYLVSNGDTLTKIAARFHTTVATLTKMNQVTAGEKLVAGQAIIVPRHNALLTLDDAEFNNYVTPYVTNTGYTMVSLRSLIEAKGGYLIWTPNTQKVDAWVNHTYFGVTIGQGQARINDKVYDLPATATMRDARTMVPLRYVVEGLHLDLEYDPTSKTYRLTSPAAAK